MSATGTDKTPRILIIERDRKFCANLRAYAVSGWKSAAVQSVGSSLEAVASDRERLNSFDVVLAGVSFRADGSSSHPALRALRALRADHAAPPVVLIADHGSEYTAVQTLKAGAFDYLVKKHTSRELIINSITNALRSRRAGAGSASGDDNVEIFGYDIGRRIARNDNVSVHVAFSAERNEDVVIKVLHRGRGSLALDVHFERFVDEFKILVDIDDPAVADIYDFRVTEQYCYIAMEYFRRGHLGMLLGNRELSASEALGIGAEIAHALSIIHTAGVVHRDLKPGNIMCREDGSIALIDFGISQSAMIAESRVAQDRPVIAGTPYYMSPEQIAGEPTDERTDLYSLGVILFQMLTGRKPYVGESFDEIVAQHANPEVPALPEPLAQFQDLIDRLLARDPAARIGSARELAERFERLRNTNSDTQPLMSVGLG